MQNLIKEIVEMDRKAREITDAAQQEKVDSEKEVAFRREEIREAYLEKARKRIALNEPKERAAAEEAWKLVAEKNAAVSARMDAMQQKKGDGWVQEIVAKVIGE